MTIGIFYASKYGTTEEAVKRLEENLSNSGNSVEIFNIKKDNVKPNQMKMFDFILIGGSIYMGKIQKEVINFCEKNEETLFSNTLGLFMCCGSEDDFENQLANNFSDKIIDHASIKGYFGYAYNLEKMNFVFKKIIKKVASISSSKNAINHKAIDDFANDVIELIKEK